MLLFQSKQTEMERFLTQPFTTYLQEMAKDGTYADHVCLQSLSCMLQLNIQIIHAAEGGVLISAPGSGEHGLLVLGYLPDQQHYVSLAQW